MSRADLTFEQAWSVTSDIAKSCREFNELQFKYRQLALSIILAAYGAMGYFLITDDSNSKPSPERTVIVLQAPASATQSQANNNASLTATQLQSAQGANKEEDAKRTADRFQRLNRVLLGIGLLTCFATVSIWLIDAVVYHRLLRGTFDAGKQLESEIAEFPGKNLPPLVNTKMAQYIPGQQVVVWLCLLYAIGALSGILPWFFHALSAEAANVVPWFAPAEAWYIFVALALVIVIVYFFIVRGNAKQSPKPAASSAKTPKLPASDESRQKELLAAAFAARKHAYAKYSNFPVGAAVLGFRDGQGRIFSGCNVENAALGETICAERSAIVQAVAAGFRDIREVLVYGADNAATPPCGSCRGVIYEFGPRARIHLATATGVEKPMDISELYQHPFRAE